MARKITMNRTNGETISQVYENFIVSKTASGVSDITVRNYRNNLHSISKHLDIEMPFSELSRRTLDDMIVSMRGAGLAHNTISTYVRAMRTFLNWCNAEGLTTHLGLEDAQNEMVRLEELNRAKEEVAKAAGEQRPVTQRSFRAV